MPEVSASWREAGFGVETERTGRRSRPSLSASLILFVTRKELEKRSSHRDMLLFQKKKFCFTQSEGPICYLVQMKKQILFCMWPVSPKYYRGSSLFK
jgi:hypothetical protein